MKIETLPDWNTVLDGCGCCEMPECPLPTKECEMILAEIDQDHGSEGESASLPYPDGTMYSSWAPFECEAGDPDDDIAAIYRKSVLTQGDIPPQDEDTYTCSELSSRRDTDFERYAEYVISDSISRAALYAAALDELDAGTWVAASGGCAAVSEINWPKIGDFDCDVTCQQLFFGHSDSAGDWRRCFGSFNLKKIRVRWVVPDTWEGSYFKVTWDLVFFPEDESTPTVVATDQTWTWTGPGDPDDEDSWKSGWYEIDPPEEPGETRIVNVRYECYRSTRLGIKPQITGEAYEIPT
jgi:hypothetical protein